MNTSLTLQTYDNMCKCVYVRIGRIRSVPYIAIFYINATAECRPWCTRVASPHPLSKRIVLSHCPPDIWLLFLAFAAASISITPPPPAL